MPDGSILVGDYWNYRIVHYNADGTPATPFVFSQSKFGFGPDTNQAPFGLCVDNSGGPFQGYVYMTEGSLYNVNQYDPNGNWVTSWGTTKPPTRWPSTIPRSAWSARTGLVYIANQWGDKHNPPSPTSSSSTRYQHGHLRVADECQYTFNRPRGAWRSTAPATSGSPTRATTASTSTTRAACRAPGRRRAAFRSRRSRHPVACRAPSTCAVWHRHDAPTSPSSPTGRAASCRSSTPIRRARASGRSCELQRCCVPAAATAAPGNGQFEDGARDIAVDGNHQVWVGDLGVLPRPGLRRERQLPFVAPANPDPDLAADRRASTARAGLRSTAPDDMYVTDMFNERIEEFTPNGSGGYVYDREWGMRGDTASTMNYPRLLCIDPQTGNLIVANTDSSTAVAWNVGANPPKEVWAYGALKSPYGVACSPPAPSMSPTATTVTSSRSPAREACSARWGALSTWASSAASGWTARTARSGWTPVRPVRSITSRSGQTVAGSSDPSMSTHRYRAPECSGSPATRLPVHRTFQRQPGRRIHSQRHSGRHLRRRRHQGGPDADAPGPRFWA